MCFSRKFVWFDENKQIATDERRHSSGILYPVINTIFYVQRENYFHLYWWTTLAVLVSIVHFLNSFVLFIDGLQRVDNAVFCFATKKNILGLTKLNLTWRVFFFFTLNKQKFNCKKCQSRLMLMRLTMWS